MLKDGTPAVVKVLHYGAEEKVRGDLDLMRKVARFVESADPELARFNPSKAVEQFAEMMTQAMDLRNELRSMQRFTRELAEFDWLLVPTPYPELSATGVLTMEQMEGKQPKNRDDVTEAGWDVNDMTQHVTNAWMSMIFDTGSITPIRTRGTSSSRIPSTSSSSTMGTSAICRPTAQRRHPPAHRRHRP